MSLPETVDFDKEGEVTRFSPLKGLFLALIVVLVAGLSFGLGRLSNMGESKPISIQYEGALAQTASVINTTNTKSSGAVYASSKGKKYYYSWCKSTVSEANKVFFNTPALAESAGYSLAVNCKAP
jgi:hypothetical protein